MALGGTPVEELRDVGMAERGEQARFTQQLAEIEVLAMRDLDRDFLVDPGVFREVDGAEATAPQRGDYAVLAHRLAAKEHVERSIPLSIPLDWRLRRDDSLESQRAAAVLRSRP